MISICRRVALVLALAITSGASAAPKNVLFYGNSFTLGFGSTTSVNALFKDIAVAAGHEEPLVQSAAASGQSLNWHLNNNTASIFTLIPPGRDWDALVMQEHSTKLTEVFTGSPSYPQSIEQSKADVVALHNLAKTRSPNVTPVLYETWARNFGHPFFTGADPDYSGPSEMQAQVRDGYDQLKTALDDANGGPTALIAPVGDAWESANYDRLHANDNWHAQNRGTLLAALVIYGTVYGDSSISNIPLDGVLGSVNLTAADGIQLAAAAESVLIPEPTAAALLLMGMGASLARRRVGQTC